MASTLADRNSLPRRLTSRRRRRRGLVLLMVVSLLALFLLMGVTFAILAIQYRNSAETSAQLERYGDPPMQEMDLVFQQVLVDTTQNTSLTTHGLLRDLYGNDYVMCPVDSSTIAPGTPPDNIPGFMASGNVTYAHEPVGGQQFVRITFNSNQTYAPTSLPAYTISPIPGYYNGRVLTAYVAQVNQWISARIAHYVPGSSGSIYIEQLVGPSGAAVLPSQNAPFVINGLPFNGTGHGYDRTANALTAVETSTTGSPVSGGLTAFLPHVSSYSDPSSRFRVLLGGADESYDAPDYQNMFLSFVPTQLSGANIPLIPSFHRPELLNFWRQNYSALTSGSLTSLDPSNPDGARVLRQIIFRPMPWDHPNFTGGNPNFTSGVANNTMLDYLSQKSGVNTLWQRVWDVDNDGDGVPDSIWIDPGLPVMTSPTGRRYKRLAAILVKDLDGRININVSGNSVIATDENSRAKKQFDSSSSPSPFPLAGNPGSTAIQLPHGLGYGPAEIDFCNIFGGYPGTGQNTQYSGVLSQRYAGDGRPGAVGEDNFSLSKTTGMVDNQYTTPSIYSTPPDVWGRGVVGMDYFGRPAWVNIGFSETIDDPYEMEFDPRRALHDAPYTISDMERLLRYDDHDSSQLSTRLLVAAGGNLANLPNSPIGGALASSWPGAIGADRRARESLTTMSSHIPVPRTFWRNDGRFTANGHPSASVLDLYYQKLSGNTNFNQDWQAIVPWDFQHGEMFNLNRLFGNGRNDPNGTENSIIDDPSEPLNNETIGAGLPLDHLNDGGGPLTIIDPRQLYARHLYCLMMLLKPNGFVYNQDLDGDGASGTPRDTARFFAQYAVNIVDFRDNDSISTGFEYDINPFDGWGVDGDLSTTNDPAGPNRAVVWGVERPELLLTEAIAWHDRRSEDLEDSTETDKGKTTDAGARMDTSFDQRVRPVGRFFFELYNPWVDRSASGTSGYEKLPNELYQGGTGVVLNRVVGGSPVWRVIVIKGNSHQNGRDPDAGTPDSTPAADFDRSIYFANPSGLAMRGGENNNNRFYTTDQISPVAPGCYAVAGSSGMPTAGPTYTTFIGRTVAGQADASFSAAEQGLTRRIVIKPNATASAGQFAIENNSATQMNLSTVKNVVGIGISNPTSLNLTEPDGGYTGAGWDNSTAVPDSPQLGVYSPPHGNPLDNARTDEWQGLLVNDGTLPNVRTLCLQRLANPTRAWDANTNPYLTIDTSSVDVTAFNGLELETISDPQNMGSMTDVTFSSFERGGSRYFNPPAPAPATRQLWRVEPVHAAGSGNASPFEGGTGPHIFRKELFCTLGYLNNGYGTPFTTASGVAPIYVGAPSDAATQATFPWLVFNNRPFMSPAELLQVPVTSQSQLLARFSILNGPMPTNVYDNGQEPDQYFAHLPNFLRTNQNVGTIAANDGPLLARLLDYVETPSRFVGTERFYDPNQFRMGAPPNSVATGYKLPFNHLSRFRDPGRVNLNTFGDDRIWAALAGEYQPGATSYVPFPGWPNVSEISLSRQGYAGTPGQMNNNYPSIFSNPFRATEAADLMPNVGVDLRRREADAALLRRREGSNDPLLATAAGGAAAIEPTRGSFFRYQPLQKVLNNVTTNSNCYAVWVTVGYFEVEDVTSAPNPQDPRKYPDNFQLGQELGIDIGNTQRHRAFYLLDRSIPVGFIPGLKLNSDDCVLLKRQID